MLLLLDERFSQYGEIAEARARMGSLKFPDKEQAIRLGARTGFYRFPFKTLWNYKEGMSALVIRDGGDYLYFYLDRVIFINPGVEFGFIAIGDDSIICSKGERLIESYETHREDIPEIIKWMDDFRFYMVFDQEAKNGLYFRGESHLPYELVYIKSGSMNVFCDGKNHLLSSGDIMLIGKNTWHMMYSEEDVKFCTITFLWNGLEAWEGFSGIIDMDMEARFLISSIIDEDKRDAPDSREYQGALLKVLVLRLRRNYESASPAEKDRALGDKSSGKHTLERAVRLINENLSVKYGVNELSRDLCVSRAYITRLFNENMGISPARYITLMRIEEAKSLLEAGDIKVGQVAERMGYSNIHHFSRQFTKLMGVSPKKYSKGAT